MALTPVTIDFECFWSQTYSLSKMTPIEYVWGDEYETQSCAVKVGSRTTEVYFGHDDIAAAFAEIDWSNAIAVGHNMSEFDSLILSGKFNVTPRLWTCTLALARGAGHAKTVGGSLKALAEHYGLQAKGSLEATNTKGLRLVDFTPEMRAAVCEYNKRDTDITYELFKILRKQTSADEMRLLDRTIRMLVEPRFECDVDLLRRGLKAERKRKERLLTHLSDKLGIPPDDLLKTCRSPKKAPALFESLGAVVPTKISPTTGKQVPALAKNDVGMAELLEHPDEDIAGLAALKLGVQSSTLENRIIRFIQTAEIYGGKMPVPIRYAGALQTKRAAGAKGDEGQESFKLNMQNLYRVIPGQPKISDVLRRSLRAPEGHKVFVADLSGIEMRVNHFLWQVEDSMNRWAADRKADMYKPFAADHLYHIPINTVEKPQRMAGKVAQLQLGYRSGWKKLQHAGRFNPGFPVIMDDAEAKRITDVWRQVYWKIVEGWERLDHALSVIHDGGSMFPIDPWGLCVATRHGIKTPKWAITYPKLHQRETGDWRGRSWFYYYGKRVKAVHGGVSCENVCQHLAGQVLSDAKGAYEREPISKECPLVLEVHDELVGIAPDHLAQEALDILQDKLRTPPTWWTELITYSEGGIAQDYGSIEK